MRLGDKGKKIIKKYDGCRLNWYELQDVGSGAAGSRHYEPQMQEIKSMSEVEIEAFFERNIGRFEEYVEQTEMGFTPNQNQFDALVSFTYNCGPASLKKLVDGRGPKEIAERMLLFCETKGSETKGSVERRRWEERRLFLEGMDVNTQKGQENGTV